MFDKTGTMTRGVFEVVGVHHNTMPEEELLKLAAHAECHSSHPISKSLQAAYGKSIDQSLVSDVEEIGGNGVIASVDGKNVAVGNQKLMKRIGIDSADCHMVGTIVHIAVERQYAGHILIADVIKPNAKEAIRALKHTGIKKCVMLIIF